MFGQKSLRQFIAVAEELNFRRAARRLHITQPPLTQGIQRLEAQLGVPLFERSRSRVSLTPAGAVLLDDARRLLAQTERALESARRAQQGVTGLLRVAFVPSVGLHFLPEIVRSFRERHPEVHLELAAQTSSQQLEGLRRGAFDVGIVVSPSERSPDDAFEFDLLFRADMCTAVPAGHRLARRRRMALAQLANEPFVMLSALQSPAFMGAIYSACSRAGFVPRVVQEASPIQAVLAMVACGVGVSLVPDAVRAAGHEAVAFVSLTDRPKLDYGLSAVWLRERESPLLRSFVEAAKGRARSGGAR
jgi:DNA-binding transcriptional LysR family regulator